MIDVIYEETIKDMCGIELLDGESESIQQALLSKVRVKISRSGGDPYTCDVTNIGVLKLVLIEALNAIKENIAAIRRPFRKTDLDLLISRKIKKANQAMIKATRDLTELKMEPNCDYVCGECGQRTIFFVAIQTRSSDEASTLFFRCLSCDHNWKRNE